MALQTTDGPAITAKFAPDVPDAAKSFLANQVLGKLPPEVERYLTKAVNISPGPWDFQNEVSEIKWNPSNRTLTLITKSGQLMYYPDSKSKPLFLRDSAKNTSSFRPPSRPDSSSNNTEETKSSKSVQEPNTQFNAESLPPAPIPVKTADLAPDDLSEFLTRKSRAVNAWAIKNKEAIYNWDKISDEEVNRVKEKLREAAGLTDGKIIVGFLKNNSSGNVVVNVTNTSDRTVFQQELNLKAPTPK
jgi:hypothetical protein